MDGLGTPEVVGIGAIALAGISLFSKLWADHAKLTRLVIGVVQENARSSEKLSLTMSILDKTVQENTNVTKDTRDRFSQVLLEALKHKC
jgi:hypothetical protein